MARLSGSQLVDLVTRYRFQDRRTAIAVILGESGGDPSAVNREPGNIDRGLWQISSKWHPNFSDAAAFDVERSTAYAWNLSRGGTDFSLWNATKHRNFPGHLGTAQGYLSAAGAAGKEPMPGAGKVPGDSFGITDVPALPGMAAGAAVDAAGNIVSGAGDVLAMLGKILGALTSRDFWTRAAYIVAGLALIAAAAWLLFMSPARKAALGAIGKASPLGDDGND